MLEETVVVAICSIALKMHLKLVGCLAMGLAMVPIILVLWVVGTITYLLAMEVVAIIPTTSSIKTTATTTKIVQTTTVPINRTTTSSTIEELPTTL
jgi:hypothetical protein